MASNSAHPTKLTIVPFQIGRTHYLISPSCRLLLLYHGFLAFTVTHLPPPGTGTSYLPLQVFQQNAFSGFRDPAPDIHLPVHWQFIKADFGSQHTVHCRTCPRVTSLADSGGRESGSLLSRPCRDGPITSSAHPDGSVCIRPGKFVQRLRFPHWRAGSNTFCESRQCSSSCRSAPIQP